MDRTCHWKREKGKKNPCYKVLMNLVEFCSGVWGKVELVSYELEYLAEEVSKQNVEGTAWFLLASYSKVEERRETSKKEVVSKQ